jgi:hypothetical protein
MDSRMGATPTQGFGITEMKKKIKDKFEKKKDEKSATPPPGFFRSEMGMVPSSGVGLAVSSYEYPKNEILKEKTFERLRKNLAAVVANVDGD